ncbi:hypothetical protein PYW07_004284 [Mythimna separata]|uniref:Uncharacterized protein n=1 Tax=Mythimna separata TaxID=271217 RepID=A0AAD7YVH4_MYTSE|nr:hypothetical protein PYW07_004284 [Mythimna separata]
MPRKYWPYYRSSSYTWPKLERDITTRMNMFKSYLDSLPKNRLDYVEDLDIPDVTLRPYLWTYPEDYYYWRNGSLLSDGLTEYEKATLSTDSSIPLSRAMTDSEIDYEFYKRYRNCSYSDTWGHLRDAVYGFPSDYMASLNRYMSLDTDVDDELLNADLKYASELAENRRRYNEERRRRLRRQFDEDCRVYSPGDPSLLELQDKLRTLDMKVHHLKNLEADLANARTFRSRLRSRLALNRLRRTLYNSYWW